MEEQDEIGLNCADAEVDSTRDAEDSPTEVSDEVDQPEPSEDDGQDIEPGNSDIEKLHGGANDRPISSGLIPKINEWLLVGNRAFLSLAATVLLLVIVSAIGISGGISAKDQLDAASLELSDLRNDNNALSKQNKVLKDGNKQLRDRIADLNDELNEYKDQQATIDDLTAKLEEMHASYDQLLSERDSLQQQLDAKKLAEEQAARAREQEIQRQNSASNSGGTVYWVSGGSVYHTTPNCPTLKRSSGIMSGSVSASGKSRCCKVCG